MAACATFKVKIKSKSKRDPTIWSKAAWGNDPNWENKINKDIQINKS